MKKKYIISNVENVERGAPRTAILPGQMVLTGSAEMSVSDGFHTMNELYAHRFVLFIALCHALVKKSRLAYSIENAVVWRSRQHSDPVKFPMYEGWFVLGIGKDDGEQITYHLPTKFWDETNFAETLENAPEFDGHTPDDVLARVAIL